MTRKRKKNLKPLAMIVSVFILTSFIAATAWATVSLVNPEDTATAVEMGQTKEIPVQMDQNNKTNAPEPSTMALFGGGILGMIVSFIRKTYAAAKRVFDFTVSTLGALILLPIMFLTAVAIKLTSKGPVIYSQTRVGKDGQSFKIYKFRTMRVDAEKLTGPVWAAKNDNRLTPIGGFLRKAHLDEIPQLFNVLKGEMSVIGPRPERPVFVNEFKEVIPDYERRLVVKPGITGLAQVWHRYDETIQDVKKKVKYDLLYIKKMCFWADVNIIFRTFRVCLTGEGAR